MKRSLRFEGGELCSDVSGMSGRDKSEHAMVPYLVFADSVIREEGTGKCSLIGTFDNFNSPKFPFSPPPFFVVASIQGFVGKPKDISLTIRIEPPNTGHVIFSASNGIGFKDDARLDRDESITIPFQVRGVRFDSAGKYITKVLIDDEEIGKRFLFVKPITAQSITKPE